MKQAYIESSNPDDPGIGGGGSGDYTAHEELKEYNVLEHNPFTDVQTAQMKTALGFSFDSLISAYRNIDANFFKIHGFSNSFYLQAKIITDYNYLESIAADPEKLQEMQKSIQQDVNSVKLASAFLAAAPFGITQLLSGITAAVSNVLAYFEAATLSGQRSDDLSDRYEKSVYDNLYDKVFLKIVDYSLPLLHAHPKCTAITSSSCAQEHMIYVNRIDLFNQAADFWRQLKPQFETWEGYEKLYEEKAGHSITDVSANVVPGDIFNKNTLILVVGLIVLLLFWK